MFLIGLTGGIASGKSTVSEIFNKNHGVPIVDADSIARKVVEKNSTGWKRVIKLFGNEILNSDQSINREKLGQIVFSDQTKRRQLNKCLHGLIRLEMLKEVLYYLLKGYHFIILDVPLLFESKFVLNFLSYKVVVYCGDEEAQLERLRKRNPQMTLEDAKNRINSQMKNSERIKLADFCIDNSQDLEHTKSQCENLNKIFSNSKRYIYIRFGLALLFGSFISGLFLFFNCFK